MAAIQRVEQDYIFSLFMIISFVKASRMEPAQLLDIVQKMKKLEQKDIDDYLPSLSSQRPGC
ncbi:TPA: hypothetical protein JD053_17095 [Klebsiella michiganensis]|nr:hypothetical protein [Klebsiella michiganensis]MBZ7623026.1 hypothetical protein [Klebsiella michiganensis]RWT44928.1 hypothetical protein DN619_13060 [Klebsiella michiganensis]HAU5053591.1 hypothetical protein [Klebsiella michiganensis]